MAIGLKSFIKGLLIRNEVDQSKGLSISVSSGATTATTTTIQASQTLDRTITIPDATTTLVGTDATQTLTNKTISGNTASNLVNGSGTFNLNSSGTITAPNATDTLVGKATTDTLTNKTLSGNTATNLINGSGTFNLNSSGTITTPNATDTLVGKATTDTLTNKTLTNPVINGGSISGVTSLSVDNITIDGNTISSTDTNGNVVLAPNGSGTVNVSSAKITSLATPTTATDAATKQYVDDATTGGGGPEFQDNQFRVTDNGDTSKKLAFEVSGFTTATTRTLTPPNSDTTIVGTDVTQTLTAKTFGDAITATQIATPSNPSAGLNKLYFKSDDILYRLTSAGTETAVGSGANTALSNLTSPTNVNQNLIPLTDNTFTLGTPSKLWTTTYTESLSSHNNSMVVTSASVLAGTSNSASISVRSGEVLGGTGSTGTVIVRSGINTAVSSGGTGSLQLKSGDVLGNATGDTGPVSLSSGDTNSTSSSSDTGSMTVTSGNSTTGASGNVTIASGTAGTTRGTVSISGSTIGLTGDTTVTGTLTQTGVTTYTQASTPSNPSAGTDKLYFKSDDTLYTLNSAGTESALATQTFVNNKFVSVLVSDTAGQTISNNTLTVWTPDTEVYDEAGCWDTGTSTFTTPSTGKYLISGYMGWGGPSNPWAAGDIIALYYRINGTGTYWPIISRTMEAATSIGVQQNGAAAVRKLTATDTVQIIAYQNSGGTCALSAGLDQTNISIVRIGD